MFSLFRVFISVAFMISGIFLAWDISHAASGKIQSQIESTGATDEVNEEDEAKIRDDIHSYIIESYKAQGNKILKDLDVKLQKSIPERSDRIEAYKKIKNSLELRKKRIDAMDASQIKKEILWEFLDHMTTSIEKKIGELQNE